MKSYLPTAILILVALLATACQPAAEQPDPATEAAQQAEDIAAIRSAFDEGVAAGHAGDAAALAACWFTEDTVTMQPNLPTRIGKEAHQSYLQTTFDQFAMKITAQTEEVEVAGDWGFIRLNFTQTLTPKAGGEPIEVSGRWLQIWKRGPDGSWKVARQISNSDEPLPGTE